MEIKTYTYTREELHAQLTNAMHATVAELASEGLITQEVADTWSDTHACIVADRGGFLSRWIAKFWPDLKDEHWGYVIISARPRI